MILRRLRTVTLVDTQEVAALVHVPQIAVIELLVKAVKAHSDRPIIWAGVDLAERKRSWTGASFKDICWFERREAAYSVLSGALLPRQAE